MPCHKCYVSLVVSSKTILLANWDRVGPIKAELHEREVYGIIDILESLQDGFESVLACFLRLFSSFLPDFFMSFFFHFSLFCFSS